MQRYNDDFLKSLYMSNTANKYENKAKNYLIASIKLGKLTLNLSFVIKQISSVSTCSSILF